jgi:hypothetical protein
MPNYAPFCALKLMANAYEAMDEKPLEIAYGGFWDTFYQPPRENSLRCMIRTLFAGMGINKKIVVVSVFGTTHLTNLQKEPNTIYVGFSGEPHSLNSQWFDINLIMEPSNLEKNIVSLPNFITNIYEFGLWPYLQLHRPMYPLDKKRFCTFVVRNGGCSVRNKFMQLLSKYKSVDCAGTFMNNLKGLTAPDDEHVYGDTYLGFLQSYKFMICFENCKKPGYITEKILNAYMAGCIPIYWGSHEALTWLNPKAFLFLKDESLESMQQLIEQIKEMDQHPEFYQAMFKEPLIHRIPEEWTIEHIRKNIQFCLQKQGLCT